MSAKKALKDIINHAKNIRVARGSTNDVRALAAEIEKLAGAVLQLERNPPVGPLPPWRAGTATDFRGA
jgi:hypothetical protein